MRMKVPVLVALVAAPVLAVLVVLYSGHTVGGSAGTNPTTNGPASTVSTAITNQSVLDLRKVLVDDYNSTNRHDSITSLLTQQLIAERLRTNDAFLAWATNEALSVIMQFATNETVPIYGAVDFTAQALQFDKVTVEAPRGLQARAVFDPHPDSEGPLVFIVEGGIHPTIQLVQNGYRVESYQLDQQSWQRAPRKIGRMDWSVATAPLDKSQVDALAQIAFHEMTGLDLKSFNVEIANIRTPKILKPNVSHPDVVVTGSLNATIITPKDYVYPFVTFQYGDSNGVKVPFSGEMVQTSAGHGEFVDLFAVVRNTNAIFELGEKFFGQGTWEQDMLNQVTSMDTEHRGEVYRRIFQH